MHAVAEATTHTSRAEEEEEEMHGMKVRVQLQGTMQRRNTASRRVETPATRSSSLSTLPPPPPPPWPFIGVIPQSFLSSCLPLIWFKTGRLAITRSSEYRLFNTCNKSGILILSTKRSSHVHFFFILCMNEVGKRLISATSLQVVRLNFVALFVW